MEKDGYGAEVGTIEAAETMEAIEVESEIQEAPKSEKILAKDAAPREYYRTQKDSIVMVLRRDEVKGKVVVQSLHTGAEIAVSEDYVLFSNISEALRKHNYTLTEDGRVKTESPREQKEERKETKTAYIDNLLRGGTEFNEIVKLVKEKYPQDEMKIKRLLWSRRAVLKKEQKHE